MVMRASPTADGVIFCLRKGRKGSVATADGFPGERQDNLSSPQVRSLFACDLTFILSTCAVQKKKKYIRI